MFTKLVNMVWAEFGAIWDNFRGVVTVPHLPARLDGYTFVRNIQPDKVGPIAVGVYTDGQGQQIAVKVWEGRYKTRAYYEMFHEIVVMSTLADFAKRNRRRIPAKLRHVHVPEVVWYELAPKKLLLATAWSSGDLFKTATSEQQIALYEQCRQYFGVLSGFVTPAERKIFGDKTRNYFFCLYPVIILTACFRYPELIPAIVSGALHTLGGFRYLASELEQGLVHGDLHGSNILWNSRETVIVDTANVMWSYAIVEYLATLASPLTPKALEAYVAHTVRTRLNSTVKQRLAGRFVAAFVGIFDLTIRLTPAHVAAALRLIRGDYFPKHPDQKWPLVSMKQART